MPSSIRPTRPASRRWVWYFVVLALMGATAIILPIVYNLSLQLRPEDLAAARQRWKANGPRDYDLQFQEKITEHGESSDSEWYRQGARRQSDGGDVRRRNAAGRADIRN